MYNTFSENQLLITLARTKLSNDNLNLVQQILQQEQLDWDYILQASLRNGVSALLYFHLSQFNGLMPVRVNAQLAKVAHTTAFYNTCYYQELEKILTLLNKSGIKVIILKGSLLLERIYQNFALRSMSDIDLLIKKEDFSKANEILTRQGFDPQDNFLEGWHFGNIPYARPGLGLKIDLHWNPAKTNNPFSIDMQQIWTRCGNISIANTEAYTLSVEDMILFCCQHALFNHYLGIGLKAFCDIAEIIKFNQGNINWPDLANQAIKYKLSFVVYAGLQLTQRLNPSIIPPEIFEELELFCSNSQLKWLKQISDRVLVVDNSNVMETLIRLRMITNIKDKIKLLRLIFFPSIIELALRYSFPPDNRLAYLYYLLPNLKECLIKLVQRFNPLPKLHENNIAH